MSTIPTTKEFYDVNYSDDAVVMMREFAKLHVEATQEAWFNKIKSEGLVTEVG